MNKRRTSSLQCIAVRALLFGMLAFGIQVVAQQSAPAPQDPTQQPRQQPGQTPDQSAPQAPDAQSQAQPQAQPGTQTFTGVIVKAGDKYVLQDTDAGSTYDVDHQDQVKQFEGKKVRIHGTLDPGSKTIHIQ
jgi:hypothetical protein